MQTALVIILGVIAGIAIWAYLHTVGKLKNTQLKIRELDNELDENQIVFNRLNRLNDENEKKCLEEKQKLTDIIEVQGKDLEKSLQTAKFRKERIDELEISNQTYFDKINELTTKNNELAIEKQKLSQNLMEKTAEIKNLESELKQMLEIQKQKHTKFYFFSPMEKANMQKHNVKKYGVYYRKFVKVDGKTIEYTTAFGPNDVDVPHYSDSVLVTRGVFDEVAIPYDAHGQEIKDREIYQSWIDERLKMFEENTEPLQEGNEEVRE